MQKQVVVAILRAQLPQAASPPPSTPAPTRQLGTHLFLHTLAPRAQHLLLAQRTQHLSSSSTCCSPLSATRPPGTQAAGHQLCPVVAASAGPGAQGLQCSLLLMPLPQGVQPAPGLDVFAGVALVPAQHNSSNNRYDVAWSAPLMLAESFANSVFAVCSAQRLHACVLCVCLSVPGATTQKPKPHLQSSACFMPLIAVVSRCH